MSGGGTVMEGEGRSIREAFTAGERGSGGTGEGAEGDGTFLEKQSLQALTLMPLAILSPKVIFGFGFGLRLRALTCSNPDPSSITTNLHVIHLTPSRAC